MLWLPSMEPVLTNISISSVHDVAKDKKGVLMKIGELNTWTPTLSILLFTRLHAPRQTRSFWFDVYLPCLRDTSVVMLKQRAGLWCERWKIGPDRSSCASKLLFYVFDAYWRECELHQALSPRLVRFVGAIQLAQMHHFRWTIRSVISGQQVAGIAACPGPIAGRRGPRPGDCDYRRVTQKAVRLAVWNLLARAGLPPLGARSPGRPKEHANRPMGVCEQLLSQREPQEGQSPRQLTFLYSRLHLWLDISSRGAVLKFL